jgi:hypothetical protein
MRRALIVLLSFGTEFKQLAHAYAVVVCATADERPKGKYLVLYLVVFVQVVTEKPLLLNLFRCFYAEHRTGNC